MAHISSTASRERGTFAKDGVWRTRSTERMMKPCATAQNATDVQKSPTAKRDRMECVEAGNFRESRKLTLFRAGINP